GSNLGSDFVFVLEPGRANDSGFLHAVDQWFFAKDVLAAVHRPVGNKRVSMIERATNNPVDVLLLETETPVRIAFGVGKFFGGRSQMLLIDITDSDDVFFGNSREMLLRAVAGGN